jgi:hypothetical protein
MRLPGRGANFEAVKRAVFSLLALLAGVAGCATGRYVIGPDGQPAIYIRCPSARQDKCAIKAERSCPYGYQVLEPPAYGRMMIRCN